jgi:hypothetical protein
MSMHVQSPWITSLKMALSQAWLEVFTLFFLRLLEPAEQSCLILFVWGRVE